MESQIRHSIGDDNLPEYGLQRIIRNDDEEEDEYDLVDQSFQTMRADDDAYTSFYEFQSNEPVV